MVQAVCLFMLAVLLGCETVNGVTRDVANTARNIRDILGLGKEIDSITK